jgi:hypothetical protein
MSARRMVGAFWAGRSTLSHLKLWRLDAYRKASLTYISDTTKRGSSRVSEREFTDAEWNLILLTLGKRKRRRFAKEEAPFSNRVHKNRAF